MNTERDHLDAETLAAWMDNGLDDASRAAAEAHASNCERCQVLLATAAKTMPVPLKADTTGFSRIRWWLAPVAAAAAAVTLWMVVPHETIAPSAPQQESKVAEARDAVAPAPALPQAAPPTAAAPAPAPAEAPSASPARQRRADSVEATAGAAPVATKDQEAEAKRESSTLQRADASFGERAQKPVGAAASAPAAPAPPATPATANERRAEPLAEAVTVAPLKKQVAPAIEIVSPNPASRWRVAQGFLERSEDGGASWQRMRPVAPDEIRAGSSPSRLVCWLVGARGLVLLATDGTNFTRLPFPEQIDLASVIATSATAATVTAADGRTLVTTDAGRTWYPR